MSLEQSSYNKTPFRGDLYVKAKPFTNAFLVFRSLLRLTKIIRLKYGLKCFKRVQRFNETFPALHYNY